MNMISSGVPKFGLCTVYSALRDSDKDNLVRPLLVNPQYQVVADIVDFEIPVNYQNFRTQLTSARFLPNIRLSIDIRSRELAKSLVRDSRLSQNTELIELADKIQKIFETNKTQTQQIELLANIHQFSMMIEQLNHPVRAQLRQTIKELEIIQSHLQVLNDWGRLNADFTTRQGIHTMTPEALNQLLRDGGSVNGRHYTGGASLQAKHMDSWLDQTVGEPVADMIVIGGGPAGLAAGYYASQQGLRTILLEGGYVGQSFSDAGIKSVHWMRTSQRTTTIALRDLVPDPVYNTIGMEAANRQELARTGGTDDFRSRALLGHKEYQKHTGNQLRGRSSQEQQGGIDPVDPVTRSELFQYCDWVADAIVQRDNALLLEKSPTTKITKRPDNLYEVETLNGYRLLTRKLILSTGAVGSNGENSNVPKLFHTLANDHPDSFVLLGDHNALANVDAIRQYAPVVENMQPFPLMPKKKFPEKQFIVSDGLLGRPEIQYYLAALPKDSQVAIVGSGESAAKAAIEVLIQNPDVHVNLFTKYKIEPAQVQVPKEYFTPTAIKAGIFNKSIGESYRDTWLDTFKTPITPQTMFDIIQSMKDGHLKVFELGENFDENTVKLKLTTKGGRQVTQVWADEKGSVVQALEKQNAEYIAAGLPAVPLSEVEAGKVLLAEIDGAFVTAGGYDRTKVQNAPVFQQLLDQGLLEQATSGGRKRKGEFVYHPTNHLTSSKDTNIAVVGADSHNGTASDSAIPGMTSRAWYTVSHMTNELGDDAFYSRNFQPIDHNNKRRLENLPLFTLPDIVSQSPPRISPTEMNPDILQMQRNLSPVSPEMIAAQAHPNDKILAHLSRLVEQERQDTGRDVAEAAKQVLTPEQLFVYNRSKALQQRMQGQASVN